MNVIYDPVLIKFNVGEFYEKLYTILILATTLQKILSQNLSEKVA